MREVLKIASTDNNLKALVCVMADGNKQVPNPPLYIIKKLHEWSRHAEVLGDEYENILDKTNKEKSIYFLNKLLAELKLAAENDRDFDTTDDDMPPLEDDSDNEFSATTVMEQVD